MTTPVRTADGTLDLPLVGLGTYGLTGGAGEAALRSALDLGYRLLDTATMYENEAEVGRAIAGRDDVLVTTKLRQNHAGREDEFLNRSLDLLGRDVLDLWLVPAGREDEFLNRSLDLLGRDVLDLWLVHWPPEGRARPDVWERFVAAQQRGRVRAIGVSNHSLAQIDELTDATGVTPAVNQVKWGPRLFDAALLQGHRDRGIVLEGYSPFKATSLGDPVLTGIAEAHGVTAEQVVVRWHVQHGVVVIPKSGDPGRQGANLDVEGFALGDDEVSAIDGLGRA